MIDLVGLIGCFIGWFILAYVFSIWYCNTSFKHIR